MHQTRTFFRKVARTGYIVFKCYCCRINKKYKHYYTKPCKFSITTANSPEEKYITITNIKFEHDHFMFPKDIYLTLFFKSNMFHLKSIIQGHIQSLASKKKEKDTQEATEQTFLDEQNLKKCSLSLTENDIYIGELRPLHILESIQKQKDLQNDEIKLLLKELEDGKNQELKKKFCNFVNKIKKEMLSKTK